jgi:ATP-dependent RNA helicase DeaD
VPKPARVIEDEGRYNPLGTSDRAPAEAPAPKAERKPYAKRDEGVGKPYAPKPYAKREDGAKPYAKKDAGEGKPYAPKPYAKKDGADGKPFAPRSAGFKSHGGGKDAAPRAAGFKSHAGEGKPVYKGKVDKPKGDARDTSKRFVPPKKK